MSRIFGAVLLVLVVAAAATPAAAQERRQGERDYRGDRTERRAVPPGSPYRDRGRVERGEWRHRDRGDYRRHRDRGDYRRHGRDYRSHGRHGRDYRRHDRRGYRDHHRRPAYRGPHGGVAHRPPPRAHRPYRGAPRYRVPRVRIPRVYRPYRGGPGYRPHRVYRHPKIVFHVPHRRGHGYYSYGPRHGHVLHGASLGELLGAAALTYLVREILGLHVHDPYLLTGRWHDARHGGYGPYGTAYWETGYRGAGYDGGVALQLFHEGSRVAELADFDLDGRVDLLLAR